MAKRQHFSAQDIEDIKVAVSQAEGKTSGEIVPYFVESSDTYESAKFRAALIFGVMALLISALLGMSWNFIIHITTLDIVLVTLVCGFVGYLAAHFFEGLRRWLINPEILRKRVRQRAIEAFVSEEVFNTQERTGILIFISHFEHLVEVMGDTGINEKVKPEQWLGVVEHIVQGIKEKRIASGIIDGIHDCGELLKNSKVNKPIGNPNELDDGLRIE